MPIRAVVVSDDQKKSAKFDATPWFVQAADDDIVSVAVEGWGHEEASDGVAAFFRKRIPEVDEVFKYVKDMLRWDSRIENAGLGCEINEKDATLWIRKNRLHLVPVLIAIEDGSYEGEDPDD